MANELGVMPPPTAAVASRQSKVPPPAFRPCNQYEAIPCVVSLPGSVITRMSWGIDCASANIGTDRPRISGNERLNRFILRILELISDNFAFGRRAAPGGAASAFNPMQGEWCSGLTGKFWLFKSSWAGIKPAPWAVHSWEAAGSINPLRDIG